MNKSEEAEVYEVAEAARMAKDTKEAIRAALRDGRIKGFRWGRKWKIPRREFDKLLRGEDTA
jgi:excisionase family DNA binding protein